ncbi:MAG: PEP-CTERM sorting domain-containing protein [Sedimenticola sp.]|nr:PEP-CTERM sorting domain-containing protein [Sedimenticola sp.]
MLKKILGGLLITLLSVPIANASIIIFDNVTVLAGGDGHQLSHATSSDGYRLNLSHNLYAENPDGWYRAGGGVSNWFGEHNEYFEFENEVTLNSFDIMSRYFDDLSSMIIRFYDDTLSLIGSETIDSPVNNDWHSITTVRTGVFRMEFDFVGGRNTYGLGRTHQWLGVNNVDFTASPSISVPEPITLTLFGIGIAGIGFARKANKS